ncbi:carbon catabolite repressor protein 4 homolog 4-like isoform X2 [Asparagus officinalis]|uniref:carbon catabolite repressor protein 4 homolog 4-like isoform X2 n=1 Tax=Asparagus officinalis TaxID=4686 RepID=UPI00098E127D|nr:carbon catabolite repressor protein 4 homolog 4-like isoform X2 [Asparagus officinalis]
MLRTLTLLPRFPSYISNSSSCCRVFKRKMSAKPAAPICPKFVSLEVGEDPTTSLFKDSRFRVVSYNILAQVYVKSSYFPHSPSSSLKWKARSQAVLTDLKNLNADFLCIQELDEYDTFYKSNMESHGYSCIYVQRDGQKRDGCGIFYKSRSAELVLHEEIHYNDLVTSVDYDTSSVETEDNDTKDQTSKATPEVKATNNSDHGDPNDPRVRLKRDCVGVLAAFKLSNPSQHLVVVASTHIYWDPEWIDVKLAQVKYLLLRLTQFKELVSNKYCCTPSVIVTGDFNSTPGDEVYRYLVSANAAAESSGSPYKLCSLYGTNGGEPPFTNVTPGFTGTLDYIFLSSRGYLKPVSLLELPGPESADIVDGLPNLHHPSDHLPIGGDFEVLRFSSSTKLHEVEDDLVKLKIEEQKD